MAINNTISGMFSPSNLLRSPGGIQTTTPNSLIAPKPVSGPFTLSQPIAPAGAAGSVSPVNPPQTASAYQVAPGTSNYSAPTASSLVPPPATPTTPVAPKTTFPGLVSTLAATATGGSPAAQKYTQQSVDYGAGSIPIAQQARDIAAQFGQKYADVGQKGAAFRAGQLTTGTTPVAEGNAAITAQTTAAQQTALAQGEQAALQGIGYELTGQQQAANAANSAAGQAYTGQGQTLGALNNAAGLAQPQLGAIGQVPFSPLDQEQGTILGTNQTGGVGAAGNLLGQFQGAQALGAAGGQGAASVIQSLPQLQAANTASKGIETTISNFIDANPDINPTNVAFTNSVNQWVQGKQLTDPRYQTLFNYLSEYANTLAPVLGVGGSPTNLKTEIAQSFLNAKSSGQSIKSVLQNMSQLADDKVRNIQSGALGGGTVAGGSSPGTPSSGGGFAEQW